MNNEEKNTRTFHKYTDYGVEMHTGLGEISHRLLHGRALLNPEESRMTFVENSPRGPRSKQIARGQHSSLLRKPDGTYIITLRFNVMEKYVGSALLAEVREMAQTANDDKARQIAIEKAEKEVQQ